MNNKDNKNNKIRKFNDIQGTVLTDNIQQQLLVSNPKKIPTWILEGGTQLEKNISLDDISIYTPDGKIELISSSKLQLTYGRKYGLIGNNGSGKSTLLQHIMSYTLPKFPQYLKVVYIQQHDIPTQNISVMDYILNSDDEKNFLEEENEKLLTELETNDNADIDAINNKLDIITERLDALDVRRARFKVTNILKGLQFTDSMINQPIKLLSGGWRQRASLACALFKTADILLLDEPTNHLDFPGLQWLKNYIKDITSTIVIVSHDRAFLNDIVTDIIDLSEHKLSYYRGNYNSFVKSKEDVIRSRKREWEIQVKKIAELKQYIAEAKQSDNAGIMNTVPVRQRMLDHELNNLISEPVDTKPFTFSFPDPGSIDHALLECNDMSFSWDTNINNETKEAEEDEEDEDTKLDEHKNWLLKHVTVRLDVGSKIGIYGGNGVGKSTFLKLITGKLKPTAGICRLNDQVRCIEFSQHHIEQLDLKATPLEYMFKLFPDSKEEQIRGLLNQFGINNTKINRLIEDLSGGERSRIAFAIIAWRQPHIIIMDEPTNHLDIETIESLIHAINTFVGTVIIVSHDEYFLSSVATEYWAINQSSTVDIFHDAREAIEYSYYN